MDGIVEKYRNSQFQECLNLLRSELQKDDSLVENLVKQNCIEVCECLIIISENESSKVIDTLRILYKNYQNMIAIGLPGVMIPLQLELTSLFNFVWWSLFYINSENNEIVDSKAYLPGIQRGLKRVLGISSCANHSSNITEDILYDIRNAGKKIKMKDCPSVCLLAEFIVLLLLYILKVDFTSNIVLECLESVTIFLKDIEDFVIGLNAVRAFEEPCSLYENLFKFGFLKINSTVSESSTNPVDCLYIIKSLCLLLTKKHEDVMCVLKKNLNSTMKALWSYMGGLSALMLNDYNQCLGFVLMAEDLALHRELRSRFYILHGQLLSRREEYKEALKYFSEAKKLSPGIVAAYYYMGEEFGKIGLSNDMVDCFKDAIKIKLQDKKRKINPFECNFESVILKLVHPGDEISEGEVLYAAAVACGLIENYHESSEIFDKYMDIKYMELGRESIGERIIKTPSLVTVLHEAATMNILIGNFLRAQHILSKAINHYTKLEDPVEDPSKDVHVTKDENWLRNLLREELGLKSVDRMKKNDSVDLFTEEMVYFFDEDVIALMLSAEIDSKTDEDSYRTKLGKLISIFSKCLAQMQKKESVPEEEKLRWTLVKALSGRTCLNIANYQIKGKISGVEIERTFKRALSCNQGDKDILQGYCKFLLEAGKTSDAQKLWKTFHAKEPALVVDQCQSLALRYLLRSQTSGCEWRKIEINLNSSAMDVDFGP